MNTYISNSATRRPVKKVNSEAHLLTPNSGEEKPPIASKESFPQKKSLANFLSLSLRTF